MAKTVHKFALRNGAQTTKLKLPVGAQVARVDLQDGEPRMWVVLDADMPYVQEWEFLTVATGQRVPDHYWFVGTYMEHNGEFVWHVFARFTDTTSPKVA